MGCELGEIGKNYSMRKERRGKGESARKGSKAQGLRCTYSKINGVGEGNGKEEGKRGIDGKVRSHLT